MEGSACTDLKSLDVFLIVIAVVVSIFCARFSFDSVEISRAA